MLSPAVSGRPIVTSGAAVGPNQAYTSDTLSFSGIQDISQSTLSESLAGRYLAGEWGHDYDPLPASSGDTLTSAPGAAVSITYTALDYRRHMITGLAWSYSSGTPLNGSIQMTSGGETIFGPHAITESGFDSISFDGAIKGKYGENVVVTLGAGGTGITGQITVTGHKVV